METPQAGKRDSEERERGRGAPAWLLRTQHPHLFWLPPGGGGAKLSGEKLQRDRKLKQWSAPVCVCVRG